MLVREAIKGLDFYTVVKEGKFLIIKNPEHEKHFTNNKDYTKESILNMEVTDIRRINGIINDLTRITV